MRTSNNVLSDCYAAAIVEKFSQADLKALDKAAAAEVQQEHGESQKKFSLPAAVMV